MNYQRFRLAAPRTGRALRWNHILERTLFESTPSALVHLLISPVHPKFTSASETAVDGHAKRKARVIEEHSLQSTFCNLPFEIHHLIYEHLDDPIDVVFMGMTSPYFWSITKEYLLRHYVSHLGRWAGKELVCVGEEADPGDYPPGLFSADEEEDLDMNETVEIWDPNDDSIVPVKRTLYNLCQEPNVRFEETITIAQESQRIYKQCYYRGQKWGGCVKLVIAKKQEIENHVSAFVAGNQVWILRNLTTKEVVTAAGIALDKKYIRGPFIRCIGFGHAVMSRVLWSSKQCSSLPYSDNIKRGVWAGHRFDITTQERHDKSTEGDEEWKDVSDEVAGEIAAIWGSCYGSNWRERVSINVSYADIFA
ncbi:hypothetical protein V495_06681 [Pseudogymnoascus sp. VKM F-4514 (FW-929)]|nr:hypothetical protein V495_06681 [Pseudogymnoascus sp. VKM F-4514 (FW-929)]KFY60855.1 hypothetical protein V497_03338 [Pseudogymnoascus sp. VKM F-4516 (FW-969)]